VKEQRRGGTSDSAGRVAVLFRQIGYKTVAKLWQSLDVAGLLDIVTQGSPDLIDGEINSALEINESGIAPEMSLDFFPADNLSRTVNQEKQDFERLRRQLYRNSRLEEPTDRRVQLEDAKRELARRGQG